MPPTCGAPYEYTPQLQAIAASAPKKLSIEVGYVDDLGPQGSLIQDFSQLTLFKDNKVGSDLDPGERHHSRF